MSLRCTLAGMLPRSATELGNKLASFQKKFDEILLKQAEAVSLEHEPSQQLP